MREPSELIHSRLWEEEAAAADPYTAEACHCSGYDVYGELLPQAGYGEYLYLLFRGERPSRQAARALEQLAVALANPGPRDPSVHAAMAAGVSGSPAAAALMAALASGAGASGGAREVRLALALWQRCGCDLAAWTAALAARPAVGRKSVWPDCEHPPGFAPYGKRCAQPVRQTLAALAATLGGERLDWLAAHRETLEAACGHPLALPGVAAAALADLGFTPAAGEMLTLLLRLPGAAVHALEQAESGFRRFPFFGIEIADDPGPRDHPENTDGASA